eukprot:1282308-Rhodomonas_salina.3
MKIINHDPKAFTQGLEFDQKGFLVEGTGLQEVVSPRSHIADSDSRFNSWNILILSACRWPRCRRAVCISLTQSSAHLFSLTAVACAASTSSRALTWKQSFSAKVSASLSVDAVAIYGGDAALYLAGATRASASLRDARC